MNTITNSFYKFSILLFVAIFAMACSSSSGGSDNPLVAQEEPETPPADIVDTAIAAGNFTTLVAAVQAAGLEEALRGPGPFTVFAPTDDAFAAIPADVLDDLVTNPNKAALQDILKYHVFDGEVLAADALGLAGQQVIMLNGDLLGLEEVDGDLVLNSAGSAPATVTVTDIIATNGVIHVIDAVLSPADGKGNIVDKLVNLGEFTTLIAAVQAAGLDGALAGPGPFTLFAPTDTAFGAIPADVLNDLIADVPALTNILTYHVISGEIFAVDAVAASGGTVAMLNGGGLALDVVESALVLNAGGNSPATVTVTDYITTNGVIHVIDTVLDPNDAP
ncbi:MAG: fasciclin domain-containing protein [Desulfobacterales bacterium]|nr:fasciclin domain-containing protein [Desulfobacterales bacterium]